MKKVQRQNDYCIPISEQLIEFIESTVEKISDEANFIAIELKPNISHSILGGFHPVTIFLKKFSEGLLISKMTEYCVFHVKASSSGHISLSFDLVGGEFYSLADGLEPIEDKIELYKIWENEVVFHLKIQKVYEVNVNINMESYP